MSSNKKNTSFSIIVLLIIVFCLGFLLGYNFDRVIGVVEDTTGVTLTVDDSSPSVSNSDTPIAATQEVPITADDYFCEYWNQAIKEAENKGEELYMKKHALFYPGRVHYTKQQARNIGRKKFTESFFLSLTSKDAKIKKYLDLLKSRYLDRFENFKSFYCF